MKTFMKALGVLILVPLLSLAQSDADALRYSQLTFGGTARFMGVSGAYGALGADFSSLSFNPAGIGLYRKGEFTFSPSVTGTNMRSDFLGTTSTGDKYPFNISNFGLVFSSDLTRKHPDNKWKRINFAFGANRLNDYNSQTYFSGFNSSNSITDYYVEQANQNGGSSPNSITSKYPFGAGLFYQTYLINPIPSDTNQYTSVVNGDVQQSGVLDQEGSTTEYLFSFGSNYDDRLLLGMTVGFPTINYHLLSSFSETDVNDVNPDFQSLDFNSYLDTYGYGINAKFGLTYIFNEYLRAGAAIHTPTYYTMHDNYGSNLNSVVDQQYSWASPDGRYDYDLVTPWRAIGSIAVTIKKFGFISADYEAVGYNSMKYHFNRYATSEEFAIENSLNQTISQKYKLSQNLRLGAEYAYNEFRLRAGAAYYGSPFKEGVAVDENDFSRWSFSGGLGFRGDHLFVDGAYVRSISNEFYQPYTLSDQEVPGVALKRSTNNFVATIGYRF